MAAGETDEMLREMARVRGLKLVKSRRRKPGGDYGRYGLADAKTGKSAFGIGDEGLKASAAEIEDFLRGRTKADWKSSLSAPDAKPTPPRRRPALPAKSTAAERRQVAVPKADPKADTKTKAAPKPRLEPRPALKSKPEPKPELVIREASAKDASGIASLIAAEQAPSVRNIAKTIALLAKQNMPVFVADEAGIAGAVSYDVLMPLGHQAPLGRVSFLVTAKAKRRRGVGTALLRHAEEQLRNLGCESFELISDFELSNANSFLRRHGYQRSGYRFARLARDPNRR